MHTGISPTYRGSQCAFWSLHNEDLEMLVRPSMNVPVTSMAVRFTAPDDQMHSVFARCVEAGTDLYVEICHKLIAGELVGKPQDLSKGVEYRSQMRGLREELRVRRLIRDGLIRRFCANTGSIASAL